MYHCVQSRTPVPQIVHSLFSDVCQTTSYDGSQDITVEVEEGSEAEVGECPEPISFPEIKAESQVSCVSVFSFLHISQVLCAHVCCIFNVPVFKTMVCCVECLLVMFLHVIGWLHFCGTFLV